MEGSTLMQLEITARVQALVIDEGGWVVSASIRYHHRTSVNPGHCLSLRGARASTMVAAVAVVVDSQRSCR